MVSGKFNLTGIWWRHYVPMFIITLILLLPFTRSVFSEVGWRWVYILSLSLSLSFCLTPLFRWVALRFEILDKPNARKMHDEATPLLGGAVIFFSFIIAIYINGIFSLKLGAILIASAILFIVGLIDDIKDVSAGLKLFVQLLCAAIVVYGGIVLDVVPKSFHIYSDIFNITLTIFWIIGITNAMNFSDGMDGMAPGLGAIIAFFIGIVSFQANHPSVGWVSAAMMGSCIGFLPYNFLKKGKATIFLGDAGSTVIGFVLACLAVYGSWSKGNIFVSVASPLLIFWILIFDMIYITIYRIYTGKVDSLWQWLEYVGKDHLHHRLADALGSKKRSVLFIYLLTFCIGTSAVVLRNAITVDAFLILVQASILVILISVLERSGRN